MKNLIPADWMPQAAMKRVILHWTAGGYRANSIDRAHYHILVEGGGKLVRGTHSIADNVSSADGRYAAHTLNCNAGSIGISACCMADCHESPFDAGRYPMTEEQFEAMCAATAQLCQHYGIGVTEQAVLGHGEVQSHLGIRQRGKWDPLVLPWDTGMGKSEAGAYLRARVRAYLRGEESPAEPPADVTVIVGGKRFSGPDARMEDGDSLVALRPLADAMGWTIAGTSGRVATVQMPKGVMLVPYVLSDGRGFVPARDLGDVLNQKVAWDAKTRTATVA